MKRIISFITAAALTVVSVMYGDFTVKAQDTSESRQSAISTLAGDESGSCGTNASYTYDQETKTLTITGKGELSKNPWDNFRSVVETVKISSGITSIGDNIFEQCSGLDAVVLPDSVSSVGYRAFSGCKNLKSVTAGKGLKTIGNFAFDECSSLIQVDLGNVKELGLSAFSGCRKLKAITIPAGVQYIPGWGFYGCTSLEKITFKGTIKEIGSNAFMLCNNLKSISLKKGLTKIEGMAFSDTGLQKVQIPETVRFIGAYAFPKDASYNVPASLKKMPDGSYLSVGNITESVYENYTNAYSVLNLVNKERTKKGLKSLVMDKNLLSAAMLRAAETVIYFDHTRPTGMNFSTASSKIAGENIAAGQSTPNQAMNSWMNSQGHRENILKSSYNSIGIGCVKVDGKYYWVQCFGTDIGTKANQSSYKNKTKSVGIQVHNEKLKLGVSLSGGTSINAAKTTTAKIYNYNKFTNVPLQASNFTFTSFAPSVAKVSSGGTVSAAGVGSATIKAAVKNYGYASVSKSIKVTSLPASKCSLSLSSYAYTYNGKAKKPSVKVKGSNKKTISSKYYTVSYTNLATGKKTTSMKSVGKYYVIVKFKGIYSGTLRKTVTILPTKTAITRLSSRSRGFAVKWSKKRTQTSGYQVQYSTSSKFRGSKTKTIGRNSSSSATIKKLKSKKKYYVRVRTYKTVKVNGKKTKIYSSWSKAKSVKTKR